MGIVDIVDVVGVMLLGDEPLIDPESLLHATPLNASRLAPKARFQLPGPLVMRRSRVGALLAADGSAIA